MGESDKPAWPRYSTSELAKDVFDVLESIGGKWTDKKRNLHIIGISMGGMIAQEMVRVLRRIGVSLIEAKLSFRLTCSLSVSHLCR